jgi:hypothetical protein
MVSWNPSTSAVVIGKREPLSPTKILYEYDGPLIFFVDGSMGKQLFYKLEEHLDGTSLFLSTSTNSEILSALERGSLSIKGALFEGGGQRIVQVDQNFQITSYWEQPFEELDEEFLPSAGVGLSATFGAVPDTLNQANSFFSIKLAGISLHKGTVSFASYNSVVSNVYSAVRNILYSPFMDSRDFKLEFPMYRPAFGSVIISIEKPYAKLKNKKNLGDDHQVAYQRIQADILKSRNEFMDNMKLLLSDAQSGDLSNASARHHAEVLHQISDIVPSERTTTIEYAEFNAAISGSVKSIFVDDKIGDRLSRAYKLVERSGGTIVGTIEEINAPSRTLIFNHRGRQITCTFLGSIFDEILTNYDDFKIGARISVNGNLEKRKRRDKLFVRDMPQIIPQILS